MVDLRELERYCNQLLDVASFKDYCPNGLQVDGGSAEIRRLVSGVTASQALIEEAVAFGADLLLVHHGYFWKGEALPLTGIKGERIRKLMQNRISLLAYHLPLDAHPTLGNNRLLADALGFKVASPLEGSDGLIWHTQLTDPVTPERLLQRISAGVGRTPQHIPGAARPLSHIAWCSGAAQGAIEEAAAAGMDAFISGEISEPTVHLARELQIDYFSAGHHATERGGVSSLGRHLAEQFGIEHRFIDIPNPV